MRLEIFALGLTAFFVYNAYTDGKYLKMFMSFKKYYKMIFYVVVGISIYLLLKRSPNKGKQMLYYANNLVKYMPIDKSSIDMLSPIFDFTSKDDRSFMESFNEIEHSEQNPSRNNNYGHNQSRAGKSATKRSVSETKKKYVAAKQDWKCGSCDDQLDHTYEIDHKIRLEYGGSNDVSNLIALCRNCHGKKTAMENM